MWYYNPLIGLAGGFVAAGLGWAKSGEAFDGVKFARTLIISGVAGFAAGLEFSDPYTIFTTAIAADTVLLRGAGYVSDKIKG